ncbi:hypothetical protein [Acidovorax phage AP1]|nr:hypothetical protein [Acidovorax phage AP1]
MEQQEKTTGQIIWDTIQDLHQQGQVATRELLVELTGYKMTIIDDHVTRMIENGRLRRLRAGVYAPVAAMPEPRPVTLTELADGTSILEVGNVVLHLVPREMRVVGKLTYGAAMQYSNIQAGVEVGTLATELATELLATKREMAARQQDLEREIAALKAAAAAASRPAPQLDLLA